MTFFVDHTGFGTLVNENGPLNGLTARITTPDDAATQAATNAQYYIDAAAHGVDIIRLDVVAADVGRTIDQQIPYIQAAIHAAEAAGLGVQLEFSQATMTFDAQESAAAWSVLAPMYANDPNVVFEEANEPAWITGYNSQLLDGLASVYHIMRAAAPDKPIAVLDFPTILDAGTALDAIHGLEARGVNFADQVTVAWHGYGYSPEAVQTIRDAGYAMQMTEITGGGVPYVLAQVHDMHMTGFDLAGGFGIDNPDPQNDPYGAYFATFLSSTEPTLRSLGVDWLADGVATPITPVTPPVVVPPVVEPPIAEPPVVVPPVVEPPVAEPPVAAPGEMLHFHADTAAHAVEGYVPGATISFDGYGAGATLTHEVDGAADEYRASGPNGYDTFILPGVTDLASLSFVFDGSGPVPPPPPVITPPVVAPPVVAPPVVVSPPEVIPPVVTAPAEAIHFANQTEARIIEGYVADRLISFDGYGANASLSHEVDGAPDEYRAEGVNGFDTFRLPGVTDLASIHYVFA